MYDQKGVPLLIYVHAINLLSGLRADLIQKKPGAALPDSNIVIVTLCGRLKQTVIEINKIFSAWRSEIALLKYLKWVLFTGLVWIIFVCLFLFSSLVSVKKKKAGGGESTLKENIIWWWKSLKVAVGPDVYLLLYDVSIAV